MNRLTRHPFSLTLWLLGVGSCFADVVLHVAPRGRDSWPGTVQQPVRTLGQARDRLRTLRRDRRERATVWVHEGDYHLEAPFELGAKDGGPPDAPVLYRACDPSGKASTFAAVYVHHGYQNLAANNLFVECGRAVGARVYGDRKWSHYKGAMLKRDEDGAADRPSWASAHGRLG